MYHLRYNQDIREMQTSKIERSTFLSRKVEHNAICKTFQTAKILFCGRGATAQRGEAAVHGSRTEAERVVTWSSKKERRVDALALRADERRDKLR